MEQRMRRIFFLILICFVLYGAPGISWAQSKNITIATLNFPPISDPELPECGFTGELFQAIFKPLGYSVHVIVYPWARAFELSKLGQTVDGIFPSIHTPERDAWFEFSDPIIASHYVLITRKDTGITRYSSLDEFRDKVIGVLDRGVTGSAIDSPSFRKEKGHNFEMNVRMLLGKRFDLITGEYMAIMRVIDSKFAERKQDLVVIEPPISEIDFFLMISKNAPDRAAIIEDCNRGLEAIKADGTLMRLKEKYRIR